MIGQLVAFAGGGQVLLEVLAAGLDAAEKALQGFAAFHPVSYTHLTLPTIYSV